MLHGTAIHPEFDRLIQRSHGRIYPAVIIEISERHTAMHAGNREVRTSISGNICEMTGNVFQHAIRLRFIGIESTACDEHIQPAVVVEIDQAAAPSIPGAAQVEQVATDASVVESTFAVITK